jgi:hypothetical protein
MHEQVIKPKATEYGPFRNVEFRAILMAGTVPARRYDCPTNHQEFSMPLPRVDDAQVASVITLHLENVVGRKHAALLIAVGIVPKLSENGTT